MIKNYIFDFGNVIAKFCPDDLTACYVSDPHQRRIVSDVVFDRLYWAKLDEGSITDDEVKKQISLRLPEDLREVSCMVYDNWVKNLTPVDGMQKLISDIKKNDKKLYLLSNISIGFANNYKNVTWLKEIFSKFDGLVFSGPIGMVKPNKNIFEFILEKFELNSDECIFVDDCVMNINGAENAGIKGYFFDGDSEKLRKFLQM
ncbi:MAG: HAD family phosphatase [Clostridia bacterium]|nr:HAD family phosphatase [Clostridia bacterium]